MDSRLTLIAETLGAPFFSTDRCQLYNVDCVMALKKLQLQCVDLTVTSPPYNIGKEYEQVLPLQDYLGWCESWIKLVHRVTQRSGAFWLNLGYLSTERARSIPIPYLLWDKIPFYLMQEVVWNYGAGVACRRALSPRNEKFLWYVKDSSSYTFNLDCIRDPNVKYPNQKRNGKLRCNPLGKNPSDVWQIPKVTSGRNRASKERTRHPAQFPVALVEKIVRGFSNPGDLVLDPFFGSGTVAEVALREGRRFLGFEISQSYCEIAKQRILSQMK